ncbi:PAS domain S-box protein, partial [bacterium]|nr:PAS domain S-box protein [bacterium]
QTQTALQESEERYRTLVQKSSEAIVLIDPTTRKVVESNLHFQELIGYSQTELDAMPIYNFVIDSKTQIDRYYDEILPIQHELPVESRQFR